MGRNGRSEPEFEPGAVRIEDLGMSVADVERLGFRIIEHWSCVPAVSERDAYAIAKRKQVIGRQLEERRARVQAENERRSAELLAAHPVPRGIPAPEPGMSAVEVMFSVDADEYEPSVYMQLLDEQFAAGRGS